MTVFLSSAMDKFLLNLTTSSETPRVKKWIEALLYKDELVDVINDLYKACLAYHEGNKPNSRLEEDLEFEQETQTGLQIDWVRRRELEEAVENLKQVNNQSQGRTLSLLRQLESLMTVDGKIVDGRNEVKFSNDFVNRRKIQDNIKKLEISALIYLLIELEKIKQAGFEDTLKYNHLYK